MSALARFVPSIFSSIRPALTTALGPHFEALTRTSMRYHFPRPSERKRILRHGWKKRMSTPEGRRVLMNRILKGRFVYSH